RAMAGIRRVVPDALYAIVGDGEREPSLRDLVMREGLAEHVRLHGMLDDRSVRDCYQQCDLFVLPNREVGRDIGGFVIGRLVGTAETMAVPETGLIVPCETPHELVGVVAGLLTDQDRRERMSQAARRWAVDRFDWEVLSRRAERIFSGRSADETNRLVVGSAD